MWRCGGRVLKRDILLLLSLIVAVALYSPASWADGVDPKPIAQGCTSACDAYLFTGQPLSVSLVFLSATDPHNPFGQEAAFVVIINDTGKPLTGFDVTFTAAGLNFGTCGSTGLASSPLFHCSEDKTGTGTGTYTFSGFSLSPADPEDIRDGQYFDDSDDFPTGMILGLELGDETIAPGTTVSGSVFVPEPSSALLLICGLAVGLVGFKSRRPRLA